jgi:hypothetical protein
MPVSLFETRYIRYCRGSEYLKPVCMLSVMEVLPTDFKPERT